MQFRPHHFLCTLGFEGKGYSPNFVANYQAIADRLRGADGDAISIEVVDGTDSVCDPCPNRSETRCEFQAKVERLDAAHASVHGIRAGDRITWGVAKRRIAARFTPEAFESACDPCSWKSMGVCRLALLKLRASVLAFVPALFFSVFFPTGIWAGWPEPLATPSPISVELVRERASKGSKSEKLRISRLRGAFEALARGHWARARAAEARILKDDLFSDYGTFLSAESLLGEANAALEKRKAAAAAPLLERALRATLRLETEFPNSPFSKRVPELIARGELLLGQSLVLQRKHPSARAAFERAFQRIPSHLLLATASPAALAGYGLACKNAKGPFCWAWYTRLSGVYPKNSVELRALYEALPEIPGKSRARGAAKLTQSYRAPDQDQAAFDAAILLFTDGKHAKAAEALQKLLEDFPKSALRFRARYWLGQSLGLLQEKAKAQAAFESVVRESPLSYHGLLSMMACGAEIDQFIDSSLPVVFETDPSLFPLEILRLKRARTLIAGGAPELAAIELRDQRPRDILSNQFLLYLATLEDQAGAHSASFSILGDLIQRGYPPISSTYALKMIFPTPFEEMIQRLSIQHKVDPLLVFSLMKQESSFDPSAVSPSGAMGLMQLMPSTAIDMEPALELRRLRDPETNISIGARYLAHLLRRFNGNVALALAGYNAGPTAAERWFRDKGSKGMVEFIEAIPYRETRDYVSSIIRNYYWYRKRLKGDALKNLSLFWTPYGPLDKGVPPEGGESEARTPEKE